ncbi:hypothetical protein HDU76_006907 [Blyttiomyces sp. JEL0837]|nr:hypothetical protein HDU76_006907 [Blyttiomyces sp. JEL0837]
MNDVTANDHVDRWQAHPSARVTTNFDIDITQEKSSQIPWLQDLDVVTRRHRLEANSSSNVQQNPSRSSNTPSMPTNSKKSSLNTYHEQLHQPHEDSFEKLNQEIEPGRQRILYAEIVRESAPTSNINLENHLQRLYGKYDTWSHEFVMEWANLKRLDPGVVEILKNYLIDGPLLSTLDVHSLKEKCDVQDSRLRAKFMQAVEFLKESSQFIANSINNMANLDIVGDSLPQYEDAPDQV